MVYAARSPDGKQMLAIRPLDKPKGSLLAGTENGFDPFFSPDGQWLGFFADRKLKKIALSGGAPVVLCDVADPRGATWGEDGTIVAALTNTTGLSRLSASGGACTLQTAQQGNAEQVTLPVCTCLWVLR